MRKHLSIVVALVLLVVTVYWSNHTQDRPPRITAENVDAIFAENGSFHWKCAVATHTLCDSITVLVEKILPPQDLRPQLYDPSTVIEL